MSPDPLKKVRPLYPEQILEPPEALPVPQAVAESVRLPESRTIELRLMVFDLMLLIVGLVISFGLVHQLDTFSNLQDSLMVSLNLTLALGFGFLFQYMDLTDGRYSFGKACLLAFTLWLINASVLWFLAYGIPLASLAVTGVVYCMMAAVSAWVHYDASRPFRMKKLYSPYYKLERSMKRAFDMISSSIGLIMVSPLMLLVPILLTLESPGSPIFNQVRIGKNEKRFHMYKFRSMIKNADRFTTEQKTVLYKREDDPRITRLGKLIRKLSIDELPQLWNVVRGEMTLVGPRPPLPSEYDLMNWYHKRKFEVAPGLTGLWQILGRVKNQRDFNSVAAYDVYYIENWCLMEDIRILLKTIPVVLLQKGAS